MQGSFSILDSPTHQPVRSWLNDVLQAVNPQTIIPVQKEDTLVFILRLSDVGRSFFRIETCVCRNLKKGGLGIPKPYSHSRESQRKHLSADDLELCSMMKAFAYSNSSYDGFFIFTTDTSLELVFDRLLKTQRVYWNTIQTPLVVGAPRQADFRWEHVPNSVDQVIRCSLQDKGCVMLPIRPLYYVDPLKGEIGRVETALPDVLVLELCKAPRLPPAVAPQIHTVFKNHEAQGLSIPLPVLYKKGESLNVVPEPVFHLKFCRNYFSSSRYYNVDIPFVVGIIYFRYLEQLVPHHQSESEIQVIQDNHLITVYRNATSEFSWLSRLKDIPLNLLKTVPEYDHLLRKDPLLRSAVFVAQGDSSELISEIAAGLLPRLRDQGWTITFDKEYPDLTVVHADEWYSDLKETSDFDWFNLELGVLVGEKRINLLEPLIKLIQQTDIQKIIDHIQANPQDSMVLTLSSTHIVTIPGERLFPLLQVLLSMYSPKAWSKDNSLQLSRAKASLLVEMEKALVSSKLRWFGNASLLELGKQMQQFSGIKEVSLPSSFQATLRPYQMEGVKWLQFLREYRLNGILADDMGLGKTVQTLGHLLIEQCEGRLQKPCLIVAPTSVISNWKIETERFAPTLKTLLLQGQNRKTSFDQIMTHDLILTTYPLLARDADVLLKHNYHMVILDEAHFIKNSQAKMTQIAHQLKADHRLCLTGTPLENHLGELWSLFHFLMPGLLGEKIEFKQRFRTPIEKFQDATCRSRLSSLVKPFLFRRTKAEVIQELPPKTEILQRVELDSAQRDVYESIRLSMHRKVQEAIDKKGVERSQIIILDALLKLRQVCCDPRLLKLAHAKKDAGSAKLTALMEMLPTMLEEGRRVLLFSQFTSMLTLIEQELDSRQIPYIKLTGQTTNRLPLIQKFQKNEVPLFLISLKAGGTGLNLTAADTVIHYDPWWNPAVEDQATDRAHRMGQTKAVFVYKFITVGTVEEKILDMQKKKRAIAESILSETGHHAQITKEDFNFLFS